MILDHRIKVIDEAVTMVRREDNHLCECVEHIEVSPALAGQGVPQLGTET